MIALGVAGPEGSMLKAILFVGLSITFGGVVAMVWLGKREIEFFNWSPEGWEHDERALGESSRNSS